MLEGLGSQITIRLVEETAIVGCDKSESFSRSIHKQRTCVLYNVQ